MTTPDPDLPAMADPRSDITREDLRRAIALIKAGGASLSTGEQDGRHRSGLTFTLEPYLVAGLSDDSDVKLVNLVIEPDRIFFEGYAGMPKESGSMKWAGSLSRPLPVSTIGSVRLQVR